MNNSNSPRDKFLNDIKFSEDLRVKEVTPGGLANGNDVRTGWKLSVMNGKKLHPPFGEVLSELMRMKEKQKLSVELGHPKPLGRVKAFVDTKFE